MKPPPHSCARLANSLSRCWKVNSAIAGTFERYAITVAPSGERSPVEMSSGATISTRPTSTSGRLLLGRREDVGAAGDLDRCGVLFGHGLENVLLNDLGASGRA